MPRRGQPGGTSSKELVECTERKHHRHRVDTTHLYYQLASPHSFSGSFVSAFQFLLTTPIYKTRTVSPSRRRAPIPQFHSCDFHVPPGSLSSSPMPAHLVCMDPQNLPALLLRHKPSLQANNTQQCTTNNNACCEASVPATSPSPLQSKSMPKCLSCEFCPCSTTLRRQLM